jgi:hypothetical protein
VSIACPICGDADVPVFHVRQSVPVMQNALYGDAASARSIARGRLEMRCCAGCGFVWNAAYDASLINYDATYENDQAHSAEFLVHLDGRIDRIAECLPSSPVAIVEVGCGQGQFLARLAERLGPGRIASAHGFDPAWRGRDGDGPGDARLYRAPFDAGMARKLGLRPDILISRHTIEHVERPVEFLSGIRAATDPARSVHLFLETPNNHWILARAAVQDFFYEHCSLFGLTSLATALHQSGLPPTRLETVFGGQYIWAETAMVGTVADAGAAMDLFASRWRETVVSLVAEGGVATWGAGAKGATFLHLVDPEAELVSLVVDINPAKQGNHVPATGHAVVAPQEAARAGIRSVILMNPNYAAECAAIAARLGWRPRIIVLDDDEAGGG